MQSLDESATNPPLQHEHHEHQGKRFEPHEFPGNSPAWLPAVVSDLDRRCPGKISASTTYRSRSIGKPARSAISASVNPFFQINTYSPRVMLRLKTQHNDTEIRTRCQVAGGRFLVTHGNAQR